MASFLIVGLGNPGSNYEQTRHNIGFLAMNYLGKEYGTSLTKVKFNGLYGITQIDGNKLYLLKPMTFMNHSGACIADYMEYFHIPIENLLVIYDDISLPLGKNRIRLQGSAGGHNGIKSIINHLNTSTFSRLKVGVGSPPNTNYLISDWVLSKFTPQELTEFQPVFEKIPPIITYFSQGDMGKAMNLYNGS